MATTFLTVTLKSHSRLTQCDDHLTLQGDREILEDTETRFLLYDSPFSSARCRAAHAQEKTQHNHNRHMYEYYTGANPQHSLHT